MGQPTVRLNSRPPKVPVHTVALLPETQPSAIRPVNKTTHTAKLDMSSLSLENALAFAAAEINKVVSTPIDIYEEKREGEVVKTYSLRLKNFSITRKHSRKTIKTEES